jgi:hypothetical protein
VSDAKNSRTNKTPSAAPNVRPNVRVMELHLHRDYRLEEKEQRTCPDRPIEDKSLRT